MARFRKASGSTAKPDKPPRGAKIRQFRDAFVMTAKRDPKLIPVLAGDFVAVLVVVVIVGVLIGRPVYLGIMGLILALFATIIVFGRRATKAAFGEVEGKPGAGLSVVQSMRGDWRVTPTVAINASQDMVHRVLGRPGVILVGEGDNRRLGGMLGQEKKRVGRLVGDTPVYDVIVGEGEGELPLRKVQKHFVKLPRNLSPKEVNAVEKRLAALGGMNLPMPKGPMPKGARMPKGAKAPRQGR